MMLFRKIIAKILKKLIPLGQKVLRNKSNTNKQRKLEGAILCGNSDNVVVGDNVSFGGNVVLYANAPITIGNDTMIAMDAVIYTTTHDYENHPMWIERVDRPVKIGNHVWIGSRAIILPGIKIDDFAVVGAGSVVTSHVPRGAIVAGNPARIIKYRNSDILKSKYPCYIKYPGVVVKKTYLSKHKQCRGNE